MPTSHTLWHLRLKNQFTSRGIDNPSPGPRSSYSGNSQGGGRPPPVVAAQATHWCRRCQSDQTSTCSRSAITGSSRRRHSRRISGTVSPRPGRRPVGKPAGGRQPGPGWARRKLGAPHEIGRPLLRLRAGAPEQQAVAPVRVRRFGRHPTLPVVPACALAAWPRAEPLPVRLGQGRIPPPPRASQPGTFRAPAPPAGRPGPGHALRDQAAAGPAAAGAGPGSRAAPWPGSGATPGTALCCHYRQRAQTNTLQL